MQKMNGVFSLFLAVLLLFSLGGGVAYAEDGAVSYTDNGVQAATPSDAETAGALPEEVSTTPPTTSDLTGGVVTGFGNERFFGFFEGNTTSYNKDNLSELYDLLTGIEAVLSCTVRLPNGDEVEAMCSATWNTAEVSLAVAGEYKIIATLIPPEGCTLGEGVRTQIVLPVQILDADAPIILVEIKDWNPYSLAIAVEQGSGMDSITENALFKAYTTDALLCKDENGGEHDADILWDFSPLDLDAVGLTTITGTPIPPEGTAFADGLVLPRPTATISVQATGKPDINCFYLRYPDILFPWIAPPGELSAVTVWLSEGEGAWQELTAIGKAWVNQDDFRINLGMFTDGKSYRVQVDYAGGQTGILSFSWDDTIVIDGYWEGDRDGDDSNGNTPPGVVQPPPQPDPSPDPTPDPKLNPKPQPTRSPKPSPTPTPAQTLAPAKTDAPAFMEESNATSTTISGLRLRMMLEEDKGLQFSKQGIRVTLSDEAVAALKLADDSVFSIEILRESNNAFYLGVRVNEKSVTELVGTTVSLPYNPHDKAATLALRHDETKTVTAGSYEPQASLVTFVVDAAGQYTIVEETIPTAASPEVAEQSTPATTPILPAILGAGCLVVLVGGIWLLKRRATK